MKKHKRIKDVYTKINHNPYCQVTNIKGKYTLKSNAKNLFENNWKKLLIGTLILLAVFTYTFWSNLILVLYCLLLLILLLIATIYYNTYKLTLGEDGIIFKINTLKDAIPYDKLANIYIAKDSIKFFFIPVYYYKINITYLSEKEKISIYSFPTFMINATELQKFFDCFEVEEYKSIDEKIKKEKTEKKAFFKALGIVALILLIIIFIIAIILFIIKGGKL